jgi:hypothetical protein
MKFNGSDARCHHWGEILAGGDGKRLRPLTRRIAGDDRPKLFGAVMGSETLLHQTRRRISRLVPRRRTFPKELSGSRRRAGACSSQSLYQMSEFVAFSILEGGGNHV